MGLRFNPPPGWPLPADFVPGPGWQPDPSWPPVPPGWSMWVDDAAPAGTGTPAGYEQAGYPQGGYQQSGYQQDPYQQSGHQQDPYQQSGYQQDPYQQGGYQQGGYQQGGYQQPGSFQQDTFQQGTYPQGGYQQGGSQPQDAYGQPQYPYQQYQAYTYGAQPPKPGTNGFAIASFILGLIGGVLLSVIFGIIALVQIRRRQQGGRGLAIAGLVLSGIWIVVVIAVIVGGGFTVTPNPPSGVSKPGQVNIFSLRVGDCFQNPPPSQTALGVTDVTRVACTTPHNAQAFAQFDATDTSYPGSAALIKESQRGCQARIKGKLDQTKITSTMSLRFLFPEAQSWSDGRRTITCLVVDSKKDLTSSLLAH